MTCYKCGLELAPFEINCPRCMRKKTTPTGTQFLPDLSDSKTQHLVKLEQCSQCRMLLFPANEICPSCGTPVSRPKPNESVRKSGAKRDIRVRRDIGTWLMAGVAISAVVVVAAIFYNLTH
jgi:hypothetical protein